MFIFIAIILWVTNNYQVIFKIKILCMHNLREFLIIEIKNNVYWLNTILIKTNVNLT